MENSDLLRDAITIYEATLEEYDSVRTTENWFVVEKLLGDALLELGELENQPLWFKEALEAYQAALDTQD